MKTKQCLTIACVLITIVSFAQKPMKTYYDFKKTMIKEDYFVNAAGEKNGLYKGYNEKGIVVEEANFKNGQLNGTYKKYATYSGKREIAQSETYKDGILEGPAIYYGENGLVLKQGNYKNGKKDGKWAMLDPYNNYNIKDPEELKGAKYLKSEVTYVEGEPVMNGKVTVYYYPSGKVASTQEYTNGKKSGEEFWYFPNGKPQTFYRYNEKGLYLIKKTYYANGQLWEDGYMENGEFVIYSYDEAGSPDRMTISLLITKYNNEAWNNILAKNYPAAIESVNKGLKLAESNRALLCTNAHALLLSGKYDEAMKIYKAHLGQYIDNSTSWEKSIQQSFKELQNKGTQSDMFQKVLTELQIE